MGTASSKRPETQVVGTLSSCYPGKHDMGLSHREEGGSYNKLLHIRSGKALLVGPGSNSLGDLRKSPGLHILICKRKVPLDNQ